MRMPMSIIGMGLFLACGLAVWASAGMEAEESYQQGLALAAEGHFAPARVALERSLEADRFFEPALACLEILQDAQGEKIGPGGAVHLFKAMVAGNQGDWENYLAEVNRALELKPGYAPAFQHRGNAYFELGQHERAIADYDQALRLNPRSATTFNNRGIAYRKLGELDRAISDYTRSLGINPVFALAYYNRGIAFRQKGKWDLAILDFDRAAQINPRYMEAHFNKGLTCEQAGRPQQAAAAYKSFLRQAPPEYEGHIRHAQERLGVLEKGSLAQR